MKNVFIINPNAGKGEVQKQLIAELKERGIEYFETTYRGKGTEIAKRLAETGEPVRIFSCGGEGTNYEVINGIVGFRNASLGIVPCGSGNDFLRDAMQDERGLVSLRDYVRDLPTVTVKGKEYSFVNGVGYGIDGYCCEEGDKQREKTEKPINYTAIAVKGVFFHYKTTGATVVVEGVERRFENVWIAPTMHGKYYGGGLMPCPEQSRTDDTLSVMVFHGKCKLQMLMIFSKMSKGEHVKSKKHVSVFKGKEITVKFDEPRTLQIDGETVFNVTEYTARR
jgi:diacylglycerol kinase family enzyme